MNLLKKFLRGVYYFCVGVKSAVCDFLDWYTNNRSIPRVLRSRASLAVIVLAVAAGGWGLVSAVSGMDLTRREPVSPSSSVQEEQASQPQQPVSEAEPGFRACGAGGKQPAGGGRARRRDPLRAGDGGAALPPAQIPRRNL